MTSVAHEPSACASRGGEGTPLLAAGGVAKTYRAGWWPRRRAKAVLRGADLRLWPGEVVGLVGENGSGKSTLMKILSARWTVTPAPWRWRAGWGTARRSRCCTSG